MTETAQPLWLSAANYKEYIAPMLDALGRELEGAMPRISRHRVMKRRGFESSGEPLSCGTFGSVA